jgi:hypothetical protein
MFPQIENTEIRITEEARIHFIDNIFDQLLHDEIEYKDVFNLVFYNPPSPMNRQKTVAKLMKPLITMVNNWSPANTFITLWESLQEIIGFNSADNIVDCINDVFYGYNMGSNESFKCSPERYVFEQTSVMLYFMAAILSRHYTNSLTEELELI